jgi:hypothetical protein
MINRKEGVNTELQGICPRGSPHSKWEPLVKKDVLQKNGGERALERQVDIAISL